MIENNDYLYLIMEYCSGGELFQHIVKNRRLQEIEACKMYAQILSGIEYIHKLGVVHRDLKPENLLLDHNNNIKLVDFGGDGVFGGGDDSEHELAFTADSDPAIVTSQWISFDIPLDDFVNMTGRSNIAQLIVVSSNSTVFIDNIYFRR